jgi:hypothetical protein
MLPCPYGRVGAVGPFVRVYGPVYRQEGTAKSGPRCGAEELVAGPLGLGLLRRAQPRE